VLTQLAGLLIVQALILSRSGDALLGLKLEQLGICFAVG
jgi:hypothetical protein